MDLSCDYNELSPQLKYLIDNAPLLNPLQQGTATTKEDKLKEVWETDLSSAYLGPQIWNKMMNTDDLKLEPVDLDELLNDNTVDVSNDEMDDLSMLMYSNTPVDYANCQQQTASVSEDSDQSIPLSPVKTTDNSKYIADSSYALSSATMDSAQMYSTVPPPESLSPAVDEGEQQHFASASKYPSQTMQRKSDTEPHQDATCSTKIMNPPSQQNNLVCSGNEDCDGEEYDENTGSIDDASEIENFDPSRRQFTEDELKPQPIVRKAKKMYVPDNCKDKRYWQRREKNNVAAKRSREARRIKENQIAMRARYLQSENDGLKLELQDLRTEMQRLIEIVKKYEK